jgi:hypothetical protein
VISRAAAVDGPRKSWAARDLLTPDARGHGENSGEPISYGLRESDDVHRWATWLCQRQQGDRLYGLGESMDAAISAAGPARGAAVAECSFVTFEEVA